MTSCVLYLIWTLCLLPLLEMTASETVSLYTNCFNDYVPVGASLRCRCMATTTTTNNNNSGGTITNSGSMDQGRLWWPGHSTSAVLTVDNVLPQHNGTAFTCLLQRHGATNTSVTYHLHVVYGPYDNDTTIAGPDHFVTDGSREMNLTCQVRNANPAPDIRWTGVTCSRKEGPTCFFTPRLSQDGSRIVCIATNPIYSRADDVVLSKSIFFLRLKYPPDEPPEMLTQWPDRVLRSGNTLSCAVSGGSPQVSHVIFNCSNPSLTDNADVNTTRSVSSWLIVDTARATADDMVCSCRAVWDPEPSLYSHVSQATFLLEYKATIANFTINSHTELNVAETDGTAVDFHCEVIGRSSARVRLLKQGNDTIFGKTTSKQDVESARRKVHTFSLPSARCEDMGTFTCEADSGYSEATTQSVRLNVNCGPRVFGETWAPPLLLTEEAVELSLVANPVPEYFLFLPTLANNTDHLPQQRDLFHTQCQGRPSARHLVTCRIARRDLPDSYLGIYNVSISNAFGVLHFLLDVRKQGDDEYRLSAASAIWISAIAALTILVIIVIIVVFLTRQRRGRDVQCTRVGHRGSMAPPYFLDDDDNPSNSPVPFVEVRPVSSDIQFKSTNPSQCPVSFSDILPALSSDGQPGDTGPSSNSSPLPRPRTQAPPVSSSSEVTAPREVCSPSSHSLPTAEVTPYRCKEQSAYGGHVAEPSDHSLQQARSPPGGYPTVPARNRRYHSDSGNSEPLTGDMALDCMEGNVSDKEQPQHAFNGDHHDELPEPGPEMSADSGDKDEGTPNSQSSELQHLKLLSSSKYAPESRSGTFITKIYLPKQYADAEHPQGSPDPQDLNAGGEKLAVDDCQDRHVEDQYAKVNKPGNTTSSRPRLENIFQQAGWSGEGESPSPKATSNRAYEDVIVAGEAERVREEITTGNKDSSPQHIMPQNYSLSETMGDKGEAEASVEEIERSISGYDWQETLNETLVEMGSENSGQTKQIEGKDLTQLHHSSMHQAEHSSRTTGQADPGITHTTNTTPKTVPDVVYTEKTSLSCDVPQDKTSTTGIGRNRRRKTTAVETTAGDETVTRAEGKTVDTTKAAYRRSDPLASRPQPKKRTRKLLTKRRRKSDLDTGREEAKILEDWDVDTLSYSECYRL